MNPDATIRPASKTYGSPQKKEPATPAEPPADLAPAVRKVPCEVYSRVVGYFRPVKNWNLGKRREFEERLAYSVAVSLASTAGKPSGLVMDDGEAEREPGLLGGSDIERREHAAATVGAYRPDGDLRLSA